MIPVPDHVPPPVAAVKLKGAVPKHTGGTLLTVASARGLTVIVTVEEEAGQGALKIVH